MAVKRRLSASVDAEVLAAAHAAVEAGSAPNVSGWVNQALQRQIEDDRRNAALDELIAGFEAEHGPITDEDMAEAERWARETAIRVDADGIHHPPHS